MSKVSKGWTAPMAIPMTFAPSASAKTLTPQKSCEPLVSLSKAIVECRHSSFSAPSEGSEADQPPALSSSLTSISSFFNIESFPSRVLSLSKPRNQFEQFFEILPESTEPPPTLINRLQGPYFMENSDSKVSPEPTSLEHSYTAPASLVRNLRKLASFTGVSKEEPPTQTLPSTRIESLTSRLFRFGRGKHADERHLDENHSSNYTGGSSSQELTPLALAELDVHNDPKNRRVSAENADSVDNLEIRRLDATACATQEAMDTPLPVSHVSAADSHVEIIAASAPVQQQLPPRRPVQLQGRNEDTPKVLTATIAEELRLLLPVQQRLAKSWRLVYSMDQQGTSMHTMLTMCENEKELMLVIKDTKGRVFGAYLNEALQLKPKFYGDGTCFLWKAYRSSPQSRKKDAIKAFKYSGDNQYFILCDPDFVAVGGGRGKFGLWFKSDFLHGYSARCPTFNNEPLCLDPSHPRNRDTDAQQEFIVGHLELWAFDV
ncbi:oxidation resistance protein 1 [Kickxella alabastrina]|uniref:Oxidation resistance protein 1 n=1 Tax=Kickxella alabastrina TaxID=61397 RepID=A0ACC1IQM4_9FUNG|nr:oxidation resistance protein 1 [Kickxella alabastrina]